MRDGTVAGPVVRYYQQTVVSQKKKLARVENHHKHAACRQLSKASRFLDRLTGGDAFRGRFDPTARRRRLSAKEQKGHLLFGDENMILGGVKRAREIIDPRRRPSADSVPMHEQGISNQPDPIYTL